MHLLSKIITWPLVAVLSVAGLNLVPASYVTQTNSKINDLQREISLLQAQSGPTFGGIDANQAVGVLSTRLSGSGVGTTDVSVGLQSFKYQVSNLPVTMADFGTKGCATIEPGSSTKQEFISFTGVTQNSDGTATLTGVDRGLMPNSPYTASSTLRVSHAGGTTLVISNSPPCFYQGYANKTLNELVTGRWAFASTAIPYLDGAVTATTSDQFVTKRLLDNTSFQGTATSTESTGGIARLATLLQQAGGYFDVSGKDPAVLYSHYASSTPTANQANVVVASSTLNGRIDPAYIATSSSLWGAGKKVGSYTWDLVHTFNGTTTPNTATTTFNVPVDIDGDSNNPLRINGVNYVFPANAASSTSLVMNGTGTFTLGTPFMTGSATTTKVNFTGSLIFTHNLGRQPYFLSINATGGTDIGGEKGVGHSYGVATTTAATGQTASFESHDIQSGTATFDETFNMINGRIIYIVDSAGGVEWEGQLTAWDSTTFTLNFATNSNNGNLRAFTYTIY